MVELIQSRVRRMQVGSWAVQVLLLGVAYFATGRLGLALASYHDNATLVWPPAGLALGALILFGTRLWPGIVLGILLIAVADPEQRSTADLIASLGIGVGNTLEAVVGATALTRVGGFYSNLAKPRDVLDFLVIGVLGCTLVSATIGVASLWAVGELAPANFWTVWLIWWLGDAAGILVVTPLMLMSAYGSPSWRTLLRDYEFWIMLAILLATSLVAFFVSVPGVPGIILLLAPFPVLVWAGTTLGSRSATIASFIILSSATVATLLGFGPLSAESREDEMLLLWAYSMLIGITAFSLAAVTAQRDSADVRQQLEEVERLQSEKERLLLIERERLTREMHDGLGGQLVSLLSMVERGVGSQQEISEALRRTLDDIRIVIDSLDPNTTDLPTSLAKLRARLHPLLRRNGVELSWRVDDDPRLDRFSPDVVLHLLRIIQEGVTNTILHAQATRVEVRVAASGPWRLHVSIQDDGLGLPEDRPLGGRGIASMHARARELGTFLRIDGAGPGTIIELKLPFPVSPSLRV